MKKNSKFIKNTILTIVFLAFLYIMTVLNLYKSTKRIDFNIFNSEALPELTIFFIIVVPIIVLAQYLKKGDSDSSSQNEDKE